MNRSFRIARSLMWTTILLGQSASAALSVDAQVKMLGERYSQVEEQLPRSIQYLHKTESDGLTTITQGWFNGARDAIKLVVERTDSSGRELTEYVPHNLSNDFGWEGFFVLSRKETRQPDGGTQVDESRRYFGENEGGNGQLIRELRKNAHFKPGESTDTVHVANVTVDLAKKSNQLSSDERQTITSASEKIADELLAAGPPAANPFANLKGDSEKFRVIHGSASPDGRYAIALGFKQDETNWDNFLDKDYSENGPTYYAEDADKAENIRNYVVDLASQRILGETGLGYFGTRHRYNHRQCIVRWSPDSRTFVQLWDDKWAADGCVAGKINSSQKFAGAVDLDKAIEQKTYAFVKERFDPEEGGSLQLAIDKVSNDGAIELTAEELCRGGACKGDTIFAVREQLRLHETPGGMRLEVVNMRKVSNER